MKALSKLAEIFRGTLEYASNIKVPERKKQVNSRITRSKLSKETTEIVPGILESRVVEKIPGTRFNMRTKGGND